MGTDTLGSIKRSMGQQDGILKKLLGLLEEAGKQELPGNVSAEDVQHLKDYTEDMLRATGTATKLASYLLKKEEDAKKSLEKSKVEESKKALEKNGAQEKAPEPKDRPKEKEEDSDAEDLSFLD